MPHQKSPTFTLIIGVGLLLAVALPAETKAATNGAAAIAASPSNGLSMDAAASSGGPSIAAAGLLLPNSAAVAVSSGALQCQRITVSSCQGLGYNMTAMPNLAGHTNQLEAELRIAKLLPLVESNCSNRVRFLLCSSLFPLCTPDVPRPVTACNSLCETVRTECHGYADLMQLWPDFLDCDALPRPEKHELCMQIPEEALKLPDPQQQQVMAAQPAPPPQSPPPPSHPAPAHFVWPWTWKIPAHLSGKALGPSVICPGNFTANPLDLDECVAQCERDAFYTTSQKKLAEGLILGLSAVCFVLTLFSLVTFWAEPTRFGYPERPVLFLCLCYNLFSVCFLERIVFHNTARPLALHSDDAMAQLANPACSLSPPCLASYISTSYLSLCAASWWLVFALCFFLSSHKKWSSEALEKKSGLFHVLAWVPPLAPPIAALLMDRVRPNELTGMCTAPGFVEVPAAVLLLLGLFFTLRASRSLKALQQQMQPTFGHQRFSQIRKRFLIFSLVFFVPTMAGVLAVFFENTPWTVVVPACSTHEDCAPPHRMSAWPTLVRIFYQLIGGTLTGMWVWSRKTCESYRSRLVANTPTSSSTTTTTKSVAALPKKHLHASGKSTIGGGGGAPLYSGINFHNVPVYNVNHNRV